MAARFFSVLQEAVLSWKFKTVTVLSVFSLGLAECCSFFPGEEIGASSRPLVFADRAALAAPRVGPHCTVSYRSA